LQFRRKRGGLRETDAGSHCARRASRARFVVNVDGGNQAQLVHFIALEYSHSPERGTTSVIGIEPAVAQAA
jgi:hypothetical protein